MATLLLASTVLAAGPTRQFAPAPGDFLVSCDTFDVNVHVAINREYSKIWTDSAGRVTKVAVNGAFKLTLTNVNTGSSISVNASGPSRLIRDPAQGIETVIVATGLTIGFFPLSISAGRIDYIAGTFRGHITDLCAALS